MTDLDPATLCVGCFADQSRISPCPRCGYDVRSPVSPLALVPRTALQGRYLTGRILGKPGGFGITYLGWDQRLQTRVAIKEYLPRELAGRGSDQVTIAPHTQEDGALFRYGLEQFLGEARTLARLDHPNVVRIRDFFEANRTAYLVMDYYAGFSLAEHMARQGGRLPEDIARQILMPILDGLRAVHAKGFLHRDIKPDNIYLARTESGGARPILLDFGAARQAMGERSRSLSVLISPGYAPFEQYHRHGNQGPWTDLYGAAAVLYRMVTGVTPPESTERMSGDALKPASRFGVSRALSDTLDTALAMAPAARPQTVAAFQAQLMDRKEPPNPPISRDSPAIITPEPARPDQSGAALAIPTDALVAQQAPAFGIGSRFALALLVTVVALIFFGNSAIYWGTGLLGVAVFLYGGVLNRAQHTGLRSRWWSGLVAFTSGVLGGLCALGLLGAVIGILSRL